MKIPPRRKLGILFFHIIKSIMERECMGDTLKIV